jgi:tRNA(Ile)-lysidine synthase TilS/MesJ
MGIKITHNKNSMLCKKCVLSNHFPGTYFDAEGICNYCNKEYKEKEQKDITSENDLRIFFEKHKDYHSKYNVLVPVSGGVDSSFALLILVKKFGLRVLAYHNDHGFEDAVATENVKRMCRILGVDLIVLQQDIEFMKNIWKCIAETSIKGLSGCQVCGNILFMNSIEVAEKMGIKLIVNGYSKGQAEMLQDKASGTILLDKVVDAIKLTGNTKLLKQFLDKLRYLRKKISITEAINSNNPENKIVVVPFYIFDFYKSDKEENARILEHELGWIASAKSYPKRTTNCKMAWLNTYIDLKKNGYSMYHQEYAEQIRKGEISREQALDDLEFIPPNGLLEELAKEIDLIPTYIP